VVSRRAAPPGLLTPREVAVSLAGHRHILAAILARDPIAAAEAMRAHILDSWAERLRIGNL